ncbi:MAG: glycogen debranching N-terminal domain-containing protein [Acidobacteriota bacterium]
MIEDYIKVQEHYYILATSSLADDRTRVLKEGETFAVFDRFGDVHSTGQGEQGIYHEGTRFLSRSALRMDKVRPLLLSSSVNEDNALLTVDLTNPDVLLDRHGLAPRGTLHILRSKFLWNAVCYETLSLHNHGLGPLDLAISMRFDCDFADIFEVRGLTRARRGTHLETEFDDGEIVLAYQGLDGVVRRTVIHASPRPDETSPTGFRFHTSLEGQKGVELSVTVACEVGDARPSVLTYGAALEQASAEMNVDRDRDAKIFTANEQYNDWLGRSVADLHMMVTHAPHKLYPYAGVPWFSAVFGRDGIITALSYLWVNPVMARGVLAYLAETQADDFNPAQDAEPGKILHEERKGEMAALGEHPFRRYYGSVDATPLFVMLAGAYYERTADLAFIRSIWPNVERALGWIDHCGDADGDGFVEYSRRSEKGLVQQGWKDSQDSVFHADGQLANPPIALCEVQGYVYAAKQAAATLAAALGDDGASERLRREARTLQERFERAFWDDDLGTYVLALDGAKQPCRVRTSNAGHVLFSGIASAAHARRVAETLLAFDSFSGFGIRTLSSLEVRYNPMSYHNGSVWPHDNAIIAAGMGRYGLQDGAAVVLQGLFDAALFLDQRRLPELFCGFPRRPGQGPTLYPVACSPQAWSSASAFLVMQACLGLSIDAKEKRVRFRRALLPEFLPDVRIRDLRVGGAQVDVLLERHANSVGITVLRRQGDVEIVAVS